MTAARGVLGSTGSIGVQALDVLADARGARAIRSSSSGSRPARVAGGCCAQASAFDVRLRCTSQTPTRPRRRAAALGRAGLDGDMRVARSVERAARADRARSRAQRGRRVRGLEATLAALERGIDVALANKESLVAAGDAVPRARRAHGRAIIPVDTEHSALQQCLAESRARRRSSRSCSPRAADRSAVARATQLADGHRRAGARAPHVGHGRQDHDRLRHADEQGARADRGDGAVRRARSTTSRRSCTRTASSTRSCATATARCSPTSGWPDMRVPIAWALHHPVRPAGRVGAPARPGRRCRRSRSSEPDLETFRCLALAREAARAGGGAPCVLNAANEVAVAAFLDGRIGFLRDRGRRRARARSSRCD